MQETCVRLSQVLKCFLDREPKKPPHLVVMYPHYDAGSRPRRQTRLFYFPSFHAALKKKGRKK